MKTLTHIPFLFQIDLLGLSQFLIVLNHFVCETFLEKQPCAGNTGGLRTTGMVAFLILGGQILQIL